MAGLEYKITVPRRQAILDVHIEEIDECLHVIRRRTGERVPVFVWPMPTQDGAFIVEHRDGKCQKAWPHELTFLDSKEIFDQYYWSES